MDKVFAIVLMLFTVSCFADDRPLDQDSQETIFSCKLKDGVEVNLLRDKTDQWELKVSVPMSKGVDIRKAGNDMGTTFFNHREENTVTQEIMISTADHAWFYTVGVNDQGGVKTGYLQVMNSGVETAYESCVDGSLHEQFNREGILANLTTVD
ncbi:hypothetical protein D3C81_288110 [compost metagenome]